MYSHVHMCTHLYVRTHGHICLYMYKLKESAVRVESQQQNSSIRIAFREEEDYLPHWTVRQVNRLPPDTQKHACIFVVPYAFVSPMSSSDASCTPFTAAPKWSPTKPKSAMHSNCPFLSNAANAHLIILGLRYGGVHDASICENRRMAWRRN